MIFTQYYLDCLSQASYLVADESTGQAVVVDPRRDVAEYLDDARAKGLSIIGVINTHFHADFVSGHLELARETGAWIGYGEAAAAAIAGYSLPVVMMIKESVNRSYESGLQEGLLFERRSFHATFALADQKEGMKAFVEKRKPVFRDC